MIDLLLMLGHGFTEGCVYSAERNGGMEWWNGTMEWNGGEIFVAAKSTTNNITKNCIPTNIPRHTVSKLVLFSVLP